MITVTLTDHRTATSDNLYTFIDEHFPQGLAVDVIWTGQSREGSALLLLPQEPGHASIGLTKLDVDGHLINTDEAVRIRQGLATDPFNITTHTSRGLPAAAPANEVRAGGRRGIGKPDAPDMLERHTRLRDRLDGDPMAALRDAPAITRHVDRQL